MADIYFISKTDVEPLFSKPTIKRAFFVGEFLEETNVIPSGAKSAFFVFKYCTNFAFFGFVILGLGVTSEGVIGNIWRYAAIIAGLFGIVGAGSEFITGTSIIADDSPLQFVGFLTFIAGVGIGPLLAWNKKE